MEYPEFDNALHHYNNLYQQGNKKEANVYIQAFIDEVQKLKDTEKEEIFKCFVRNLCDCNTYDFLKERGNGKIPYAMECCIKNWLLQNSRMGKMPEMRWFYELFHNDTFLYKQAYQFLKRAYDSNECDEKTADLLFCSYLGELDFGAHHFPDGCVISDEERDHAFAQCRKIATEKNIAKDMQDLLTYYERLYSCYHHYCEDGKIRNFQRYCADAKISFS